MKHLLLIGGGHAHVHVLDALAQQPFADTAITLISPYPRQIYSGMLPGWIAGDYTLEKCAIPIERLAARAGIRFVETACTRLDLESRRAHCANGEVV
ncbi:MAG: pyridine nucleotide-disulfide oxidoreductase, partial [Propionivibrio sp.]